jgi:peptidoglycan/LPS O-acetylase OafA/YrhL
VGDRGGEAESTRRDGYRRGRGSRGSGGILEHRASRLAYQPGLDGLRALAVAAVVVYHLEPAALAGGFLGVDAFFVLSGYLITSLLVSEWRHRGGIALGAFWARRARRLLPALFIVLAAVAVYAAVAVPADELGRLRGDGLASVGYVANWRFVLTGQSYFDLVAAPSPLRHLWSLAIEEQFYLVWPLVATVCFAVRRPRHAFLLVCGAGIAVSVAAMAALHDAADPTRAYFGTDTRMHVILVGALLAVIQWDRPAPVSTRWPAALVGTAGALGVLAIVVTVDDRAEWFYRGGSLAFAVAVAALIVGLVAPTRSPLRAAASAAPLVALGRISYGVYLWHWPVQVWLTPARAGVDGLALDALRVGVTLAAASVSFVLVEQPIRRGRLQGWPARVAAPVGVATAVGLVLVATSGAVDPPAYARVRPGTVVRVTEPAGDGGAAPGDRAGGAAEVAGATVTDPRRILLVGDSLAMSVLPGLEPAVRDRGMGFSAAVVPGCSTVGGRVAGDDGVPLDWSAKCDVVAPQQAEAVAREDPDVVVWLSQWEIAHRWVGDSVHRFATPAGDATLLRQLDAARARLTAGGARLVFLTLAPATTSDRGEPPRRHVEGPVHLNRLLRSVAAAHPGTVAVVDLGALVCPGGSPCPEVVDGVRLRPADGGHFGPEGAGWAAARIVEAVLALPPAPG